MCYSVYLSTESTEDLTTNNEHLIRFKKVVDNEEDSSISLLSYPNIWYVGSQHDCSCGFRHIMTDDLGFSEPVDWYDEDDDDIEATKKIYQVLMRIVQQGYAVDLVDKWEGTQNKNIKAKDVSLKEIGETRFRFFESYLFRIKK